MMRQIIFLPVFLLAITSCNSQGEKRTKTVKAEPAKKDELPVSEKDLTKNSVPEKPVEPKVPRMEKTIRFIPPTVTDEYYDDAPPVQDKENVSAGTSSFAEVEEPVSANYRDMPQEPERPQEIVDEYPEFPGGKAAMQKYIADNLIYPASASQQDIQGKVYMKFIVSKDGSLRDVKVVKKLADCPECDKEAIRLVKGMPKFIPGKNKGKAVDSYYTLPILFKLN